MLCLLGAAGAQASPLTYSVSASFGDGGSASGRFTFDADTSTYSNVAITISNSATPSLDGTYTNVCPPVDCFGYNAADASELTVLRNPVSPTTNIDLSDLPQPVVQFVYNTPLTDAGQGITSQADYGTCSTDTCIGLDNGPDAIRHTASAMIAGPVVPTLTEWGVALFALLLSGFAVLRLRQAASA